MKRLTSPITNNKPLTSHIGQRQRTERTKVNNQVRAEDSHRDKKNYSIHDGFSRNRTLSPNSNRQTINEPRSASGYSATTSATRSASAASRPFSSRSNSNNPNANNNLNAFTSRSSSNTNGNQNTARSKSAASASPAGSSSGGGGGGGTTYTKLTSRSGSSNSATRSGSAGGTFSATATKPKTGELERPVILSPEEVRKRMSTPPEIPTCRGGKTNILRVTPQYVEAFWSQMQAEAEEFRERHQYVPPPPVEEEEEEVEHVTPVAFAEDGTQIPAEAVTTEGTTTGATAQLPEPLKEQQQHKYSRGGSLIYSPSPEAHQAFTRVKSNSSRRKPAVASAAGTGEEFHIHSTEVMPHLQQYQRPGTFSPTRYPVAKAAAGSMVGPTAAPDPVLVDPRLSPEERRRVLINESVMVRTALEEERGKPVETTRHKIKIAQEAKTRRENEAREAEKKRLAEERRARVSAERAKREEEEKIAAALAASARARGEAPRRRSRTTSIDESANSINISSRHSSISGAAGSTNTTPQKGSKGILKTSSNVSSSPANNADKEEVKQFFGVHDVIKGASKAVDQKMGKTSDDAAKEEAEEMPTAATVPTTTTTTTTTEAEAEAPEA